MLALDTSEVTKKGRFKVFFLIEFVPIFETTPPLVSGDRHQLYAESTRRTLCIPLETCPARVFYNQDWRRSTCGRVSWSGRLIVGAVVARLAVGLIHEDEGHGLVYFAPGLVYFIAPAGASVATISAARTLVELPGLLLLGHDVAAVAELLTGLRILVIAPANVP